MQNIKPFRTSTYCSMICGPAAPWLAPSPPVTISSGHVPLHAARQQLKALRHSTSDMRGSRLARNSRVPRIMKSMPWCMLSAPLLEWTPKDSAPNSVGPTLYLYRLRAHIYTQPRRSRRPCTVLASHRVRYRPVAAVIPRRPTQIPRMLSQITRQRPAAQSESIQPVPSV